MALESAENFEGEGKTLNSEARFFLPLQPYPFPAPPKGSALWKPVCTNFIYETPLGRINLVTKLSRSDQQCRLV